MKKPTLYLSFFILVGLSVSLSGCFGRIDDAPTGGTVDRRELGLSEEKPALLVFSALWCHPCLAEIETLNQAQTTYGHQIEILGLVVEGASKGESINQNKLSQMKSSKGVVPSYRLMTDGHWKWFDKIRLPSGHQLPALVFVNHRGKIVRMVQRSLDYEGELAPELDRLLGATPTPAPIPSPSPQPGELKKDLVSVWSKIPGANPDTPLYENVRSAWHQGLLKFTFPEEEMPLESGQMNFIYSEGSAPTPIQCEWVAEESGCRLTVKFHPDGTFKSADGVCGT